MLDRAPRRSLDRLIQTGIAPRRARRILLEFSEHHADLVAEQRSLGAGSDEAEAEATARLGTEQRLVADLLTRRDLRSWARRRPGIAFALTPLLSFAAAFAMSLALMVALLNWRKAQGDPLNSGSALMYWISEYAAAYLLWGLPLAAALTLALVSMTAGIGISTDHIGRPLIRAVSAAALALLPYIGLRYLQRREIDALG